jgi:hypothetical protein
MQSNYFDQYSLVSLSEPEYDLKQRVINIINKLMS